MRIWLIVTAVMCLSPTLTPHALAADTISPCVMKGAKLVCGKSYRQHTKIAHAMAHPDTLILVQGLGVTKNLAQSAQSREVFRKSLERNHRAMKLYADRQFRRYKRRKLSAEDYEAVRVAYNEGLKVYKAGLDAYRENRWFDPKAPKDKKLRSDTN